MSKFFRHLEKNYHYNIHQNICDINIFTLQFKNQIRAKPNLHIYNTKYHIQTNKTHHSLGQNQLFLFLVFLNCFLSSVYEHYFSSEVLIFYFYSF